MRVGYPKGNVSSLITIDADIDMDSHKLTSLSAGSGAGHSLRYEQVIDVFLLLAGGTLTGDLSIGAHNLKTTNLEIAEYDSTSMVVRETGNTALKNFRCSTLYPKIVDFTTYSTCEIKARDITGGVVQLKARGASALEIVAKLQGHTTQPRFEHTKPLNVGADTELTIDAGVITITGSFHAVDTEGAAATDDLDTINGGKEGDFLVLKTADDARDVTLTENGNIKLAGATLPLTTTLYRVLLFYDGTKWTVIAAEGIT